MIRFCCGSCGNEISMGDEQAGEVIACLLCGKRLRVPLLEVLPLPTSETRAARPRPRPRLAVAERGLPPVQSRSRPRWLFPLLGVSGGVLLGFLVLCAGFLLFSGKSTTSPPPQPGGGTRAPELPAVPEAQAALGTEEVPGTFQRPVTRGVLRISLLNAWIGKARLKERGFVGLSDNRYLHLLFRLENVSAAGKADYHSWAGSFLSRSHVRDDLGNHYKGIDFGFMTTVVGRTETASLYPGQMVEDLLIFQPPVEQANLLTVLLDGRSIEKHEDVCFAVPRSIFGRQAADGASSSSR